MAGIHKNRDRLGRLASSSSSSCDTATSSSATIMRTATLSSASAASARRERHARSIRFPLTALLPIATTTTMLLFILMMTTSASVAAAAASSTASSATAHAGFVHRQPSSPLFLLSGRRRRDYHHRAVDRPIASHSSTIASATRLSLSAEPNAANSSSGGGATTTTSGGGGAQQLPNGDNANANGSASSSAPSASPPPNASRTLYEILNTTPDATRQELKAAYVSLAKQSHPDALLDPTYSNNEADLDFNEIAQAYRTLSDPKLRRRYDRSLLAESIQGSIEETASDLGKKVGPTLKRTFEGVVLPTLRRTTATAVAAANAVSDEIGKASSNRTNTAAAAGGAAGSVGSSGAGGGVQGLYGAPKSIVDQGAYEGEYDATKQRRNGKGGGVDLSGVMERAIRAGRNANRVIDKLELLEKSEELERRAEEEIEEATSLHRQLASVVDRRLEITLHTPDSNLTSDEATHILDGLNTVDEVGFVGRWTGLQHTVQFDIDALSEAEEEWDDKEQLVVEAENDVDAGRDALERAERNVEKAVEAEDRARKAYDAAQRLVASSRREASECERSLTSADLARRRVQHESDKARSTLQRRRENVRRALVRKEKEEGADSTAGSPASVAGVDGTSDAGLVEIERLRKDELLLRSKCRRLEDSAARLKSRAAKLRLQSEVIEEAEREQQRQ